MRRAEILIAGFFILISAVCIFEAARLGFGYEKYGPAAGFIIFWLAVLQLVMAAVILNQGIRKKFEAFFINREAMIEVGYVTLTSALFCAMMQWLGTYIACFIYSCLFAAWLGKHRWYGWLGLAVIMTLAIYFGFEKGLMIPLPKSPWYIMGLPF
jgi:magnesium-transporting ATPase (P-type)